MVKGECLLVRLNHLVKKGEFDRTNKKRLKLAVRVQALTKDRSVSKLQFLLYRNMQC